MWLKHFITNCVEGRTLTEVIRKKHNLKVYANYFGCHFIIIRLGSLERDYTLSKGDITLGKVLRSQHGKDARLHDSLGSSTCSKPTSYDFC